MNWAIPLRPTVTALEIARGPAADRDLNRELRLEVRCTRPVDF